MCPSFLDDPVLYFGTLNMKIIIVCELPHSIPRSIIPPNVMCLSCVCCFALRRYWTSAIICFFPVIFLAGPQRIPKMWTTMCFSISGCGWARTSIQRAIQSAYNVFNLLQHSPPSYCDSQELFTRRDNRLHSGYCGWKTAGFWKEDANTNGRARKLFCCY